MTYPRSGPALGLLAVALGALMLAGAAVTANIAEPPYATQKRLLPADSPSSESRWNAMCTRLAAFPGPSTVIVKATFHRGEAADARFRDIMSRCHNPEQRIVGYVDTKNTRVSLDRVEQVIDAYYNAYPDIDGVFLDDMEGQPDAPARHPSDAADFTVKAYYQHIFGYVRSKNVTHGWVTSTTRLPRTNYVMGYLGTENAAMWQLSTPVVDDLIVVEGGRENHRSWSAPGRTLDRQAGNSSHRVYAALPNATGYTFRAAHVLSREPIAASASVTSDGLALPWNSSSSESPGRAAGPRQRVCCVG